MSRVVWVISEFFFFFFFKSFTFYLGAIDYMDEEEGWFGLRQAY